MRRQGTLEWHTRNQHVGNRTGKRAQDKIPAFQGHKVHQTYRRRNDTTESWMGQGTPVDRKRCRDNTRF